MHPLTETENKNRYITVISDYLTKWTEAFPMLMRNMEAQTVAKIITNEVICRLTTGNYNLFGLRKTIRERCFLRGMQACPDQQDKNHTISSAVRWYS